MMEWRGRIGKEGQRGREDKESRMMEWRGRIGKEGLM